MTEHGLATRHDAEPTLWDAVPSHLKDIPHKDAFVEYDAAHPDVWLQFEDLTYKLIRRGVKHYGAKAIFEVLRYHRTINSTDKCPFKLNNNFTGCYARKFIARDPQYEDFFEIREKQDKNNLKTNPK